MYNRKLAWLLLILIALLPITAAQRGIGATRRGIGAAHASVEYAYLLSARGVGQYRVGDDGRLRLIHQDLAQRQYGPTVVDAAHRAVYYSSAPEFFQNFDQVDRLLQFHISANGQLMPMRPPAVMTHSVLTDAAGVPGRPLVFTTTEDSPTYLEEYRVGRGGALRRVFALLLTGYSVGGVTAPTPDDLIVSVDSLVGGRTILHYRIMPGGGLRPMPVPASNISALPSDLNGQIGYSRSPSGDTFCALQGVPVGPGYNAPAVAVYPLHAGRDFLARAPTVTRLHTGHNDDIESVACTDRFVFCGGYADEVRVAVQSYRIGANGHLTLLNGHAVRPAFRPRLSVDLRGKFLYVVTSGGVYTGAGMVSAYRIARSGRLTWLQSLSGFGNVDSFQFALLPRP